MKLSRIFLAMGIAIIFAVFVGYALYVFYEPPKYYLDNNNTCYQQLYCENMTSDCYYNKTAAAEMGYPNYGSGPVPVYFTDAKYPGEYNSTCYNDIINGPAYLKCLGDRDNCNNEFQKSTRRYTHSRNSFYILLLIAMIALIVGAFWVSVEGVSSGLIGGSILTILYALMSTSEYWLTLGKYVKLLALFAVLVLLFYIGYTKFSDRIRKKK
jgi:hypothetical protein